MSKVIKQMEMDALAKTFQGVRDLVMLSTSGVNAQDDNKMRLALRKKGIRLQVVKNSLAQRIFPVLGLNIAKGWEGPTLLAWGGSSIAELSKELDVLAKQNDKIKIKTAVAEGQELTFADALRMPTRTEAIARVVMLAMAPASQLVGQIMGPAAQLAGQIKSIGEKQEEAAPTTAA